jgi:3-hydroxyisobutyrate dehydrogenase-like beta-hydroxyacid dehydrogenase
MDDTTLSPAEPEMRVAEGELFNIGFVGVGKIGLPIAQHLHRHGHRVTAFDASSARADLARAAGLPVLDVLSAVVEPADLIMSSLPNDAAFEAVALQIAACARPGQLYIDTSTVSTKASQRVARAFEEAGVAFLRVTVSGNARMAEDAQLTTIASGQPEDYRRVLPLLRLLGPSQFYVGRAEEARVMKLVINLMVANTVGMLGEALAIGQKGGLERRDMWRVLSASAVASPIVKAKAKQLVVHDYSPTFTVDQMQKDVGLILEAGADSRVPLPMTAIYAQALEQAAAFGYGSEDYAATIRLALGATRPQREA